MTDGPHVSVISPADDLDDLCARINAARWDETNDMGEYQPAALAWYLAQPDTIFLACYDGPDRGTLMGIASGRILHKPYDRSLWLYVDEVDTAVNQRQKGAGRAMMQVFRDIAVEAGCDELWLGTEPDNDAANALYRSLAPSDVEGFVGYTWSLED